jgi:hypothetical protein
MNKRFYGMKKIVINIFLVIFSIFMVCFIIHNINVFNKLFLKNKDVNNIILYYQDKKILESILENALDMSYNERKEAYETADIIINVKDDYWSKIITAIKKSKYSRKNLEIFFGKRYKVAPPLYTITIEYLNGKEIGISIWEGSLFIDSIWYDETKEIIVIIEEVIGTMK